MTDAGSHVTLSVMGDGTSGWTTVEELLPLHPVDTSADTWVIVLDPGLVNVIYDYVATYDEVTRAFIDGTGTGQDEAPCWQREPGPVWRTWDSPADMLPVEVRAISAWLWPVLEAWRTICEATGLRIVLVSTDARPSRGQGPMMKSHRWRDTRVRSLLGDAARYWCHSRIRVDGWFGTRAGRAVMLKDEANGRVGRVLAAGTRKPAPAATPACRTTPPAPGTGVDPACVEVEAILDRLLAQYDG